jgi:hypothetical protein
MDRKWWDVASRAADEEYGRVTDAGGRGSGGVKAKTAGDESSPERNEGAYGIDFGLIDMRCQRVLFLVLMGWGAYISLR